MNKIIVAVTMAAVCTGMYALAEPRVVQEASGYNSWPMIQAIGEKLVCVYSRGTSHTIAEDARAVYARTSADNGKTWTPETVVASTSGYGEVAVGKGLDSDGAMFLWVRRMNGSECVHDLYRTTDGVTFLLVATPKLAVAPVQITDIFSVPTVGLMALWFAGSYGDDGPSHSWGTLTSRDNGATWAQSTIESELTKPQWPTEPAAVYLGNVGDLQQWREAANLLRLLGHPVRLALLEELAKAPKCVTDIQDLLEVRQPNVSQHLAVLRQAKIVDFHEDGNVRCYYILRPRLVRDLLRLLGRDYPVQPKTAAEIRRAAGTKRRQAAACPTNK